MMGMMALFFRFRLLMPTASGDRKLGIIAVVAESLAVRLLRLQVDGQEYIIAFVGKVLHVAEEGIHRGAEFGPGDLFPGLDGGPEMLAGYCLYHRGYRRSFPQRHFLGQIEGVGDADFHHMFPDWMSAC